MVVLSKHSIFSLLFLILCFILSSFLLFLLECEFLALMFIIIYVGAIAILFLFAVMMLDSKQIHLTKNTLKYFPISLVFIVLLLIPLIYQINNFFDSGVFITSNFYINSYVNWYDLIDSTHDINVYGQILYSYFVLQFLITGVILLLVLIGVVYLTNSFEKNIRHQSSFRQLSRQSEIF
jgi:NADH-quinone oxidoreductase subunit J